MTMANKNISMSKVKQIIKLYAQGIGKKKIALRLCLSKNTVKLYIEHLLRLRRPWEELLALADVDLNQLIHPPRQTVVKERLKTLYDFFPIMEKQLRKRGMTVGMQFREYCKIYPDAFAETSFYKYYNIWKKRMRPTMHIEHKVGDKMYVDFAGGTLTYVDRDTGELAQAQIFVAILGWSQYAYVEAMRNQSAEEFIAACEHAVRHFGGSPLAIVPDNLKSAVVKSHRYEPQINENFSAFADHYGMTVLPARVRKPQDKAHVENLVKLTYKHMYTTLPDGETLTLDALNHHLHTQLRNFNRADLTGRRESRWDLWIKEVPTLQQLPDHCYELRIVRQVTAMKNGHVLLQEDRHYYSVPYEYIGRKLQLQYSRTQVEVFHSYTLIARHERVRLRHKYTTVADHLPSQHRYSTEWNPDFFMEKGKAIDPVVESYIRKVLERKTHPEQAYKSCQGILSLASRVGTARLIRACKKAADVGYYNYRAVEDILRHGLDHVDDDTPIHNMPTHGNIRGSHYYK
jgi:transposase